MDCCETDRYKIPRQAPRPRLSQDYSDKIERCHSEKQLLSDLATKKKREAGAAVPGVPGGPGVPGDAAGFPEEPANEEVRCATWSEPRSSNKNNKHA
eukprot:1196388-Prorocentrum_minimum.AAC.1